MKQLDFIHRSHGRYWVGDGFPVQSVFSYRDIAAAMSPFLLLDYAAPTHFPPTQRKLGVGPHPHRGFETVTLVYEGGISHRDSMGGGGSIAAGDVQWMTAAAGLLHEEYHSREYARVGGPFEMIQLWVNLPARDKMMAPAYQSISAARIPQFAWPQQAGVARIIAGELGGLRGPAQTKTPMNVWDLRLRAGQHFDIALNDGDTTALFLLRGQISLHGQTVLVGELAVMQRSGDTLCFDTREEEVHALLLSGAPIAEPIVAHGPFVMNTAAEIEQAMADYRNGRFGHLTS